MLPLLLPLLLVAALLTLTPKPLEPRRNRVLDFHTRQPMCRTRPVRPTRAARNLWSPDNDTNG